MGITFPGINVLSSSSTCSSVSLILAMTTFQSHATCGLLSISLMGIGVGFRASWRELALKSKPGGTNTIPQGHSTVMRLPPS